MPTPFYPRPRTKKWQARHVRKSPLSIGAYPQPAPRIRQPTDKGRDGCAATGLSMRGGCERHAKRVGILRWRLAGKLHVQPVGLLLELQFDIAT